MHTIKDIHEHGAVVASMRSPRLLVTADDNEFKVWRALDPTQQFWELAVVHVADTRVMATMDIAAQGHDLLARFRIEG